MAFIGRAGLACVLTACTASVDSDADVVDTEVEDTEVEDTDTAVAPHDADSDGQGVDEGDCDDGDPTVYLGAVDSPGDGVDSNCDGLDLGGLAVEDVASAHLVGDMPAVGWHGNNAGYTVAMVGDATGDALTGVVVGGTVEFWNEGGGRPLPTVWLMTGLIAGSGTLTDRSTACWRAESANAGFGLWLGDAGDVDGDGFSDLLVATDEADGHAPVGQRSRVGVYRGGSIGEGSWNDATFAVDGVGGRLAGGYDTNGDGRPDMVAFYYEDGNNSTLIFEDAAAGGRVTPEDADVVLPEMTWNPFGGDRSRDLNGDGYDDMLLSTYGERAWLAAGPFTNAVEPSALFTITPPSYGNWSFSVGDVNGDANPDLAFGTASYPSAGPQSGRVAFFLGPLEGTTDFEEADARLDAEHDNVGLSRGLSIGGDLDGDGDDEIVVGAPGIYANHTGAIVIYKDLWSGTTTTASADLAIRGRALGDVFGWSLSGERDVDGDGLDDLVVGAPYDESWAGSAWILPAAGFVDRLP